jgi:hypothetical protein
MNSLLLNPPSPETTTRRVEFFRLPGPGKRDPFFGLSRGWYYKAESLGEIKMISVRRRNALRGVRLVVYDSVADHIRRAGEMLTKASTVASSSLGSAGALPESLVPCELTQTVGSKYNPR